MPLETTQESSPDTGSATSAPAIEAAGVQKIFANGDIRVHALKGIDFVVRPGEMVAVMGASGSGKTTLLNCLSGLDTVTDGIVKIDGTNMADLPDDERTNYRAFNMGFIFQTFNLLPVLSAVENVELPLVVSGTKPSLAREQALAMLDQVGLREWAGHKPAELSGGQRQRVTVARALVNNPAIIWADEPTGSLDSENAAEVMELMRELNVKNGQTFLIVTHDPRVAAVCERLVQMKDGEIISDEPARQQSAKTSYAETFSG